MQATTESPMDVDHDDPYPTDDSYDPYPTNDPDLDIDPPLEPESHVEEVVHDSAAHDEFVGAAQTYGTGQTFMDNFRADKYAAEQANNLYYPFISYQEWEMASFIIQTNMTINTTNEFLKLQLTQKMNLSFSTTKALRSQVEILPRGPLWKAKPWNTSFPTKKPLTLFHCDPLESLESLLQNPLMKDFIHFTLFRLYTTADKMMRVYTEWLSGDAAWKMQFIEKNPEFRGILESHLFHACLHFVFALLKKAAECGVMMPDMFGSWRFCFTPLAAYIVDTPESLLIADYTLTQLEELEEQANAWDLPVYVKRAKKQRLNGVHRPFWRDWPMTDPSEFLTPPQFLTPEILHYWFKMFWDHKVQWCIRALSTAEIVFRFSVLRPHTRMRHFKEGISKAKQVTGREHWDIQQYLVAVIAGADGISKNFLIMIRSLHNIHYYGQASVINNDTLTKMLDALQSFPDHKHTILSTGVCTGKKGPINNWYIPTLEFLLSVVPAIRANGVPSQWSADVTEHAHITEIKDPASNSNNQNYEQQICCHLDCRDKIARFDLATAIDDPNDLENNGGPIHSRLRGTSDFLAYVQHFDIVPQNNPVSVSEAKGPHPDPVSADRQMTKETSLDFVEEFWLMTRLTIWQKI
ncbi:hypothetical protein B0H10DRAFT_1937642 [Mycena sp. CBHHK59/15]|nr:hypothetical protein B0H10DRAFT_1937642 [Mycena sp. CBHHK59/15]